MKSKANFSQRLLLNRGLRRRHRPATYLMQNVTGGRRSYAMHEVSTP